MNRGRKELKGVVSQKSGKTGTTLDACCAYIVKARPLASFLECVPEMDQDFTDIDGTITNGSDIVEARLEAENFTVIISCFNSANYGSAADRVRWWALVIDALPKLYKNIISANFEDTFAALTMDSMDIGEFMLGDEDEFMAWTAEQPLDKKKKGGKAEPDYTVEHEQIYLVHGIKWPHDATATGTSWTCATGSPEKQSSLSWQTLSSPRRRLVSRGTLTRTTARRDF